MQLQETAAQVSCKAGEAIQRNGLPRSELEETIYLAAQLLREVKDVQDRARPYYFPQGVHLHPGTIMYFPVQPAPPPPRSVSSFLRFAECHYRPLMVEPVSTPLPSPTLPSPTKVRATKVRFQRAFCELPISLKPSSPLSENLESPSRPKKQSARKASLVCRQCGTSDTPEWRKGPEGPNTCVGSHDRASIEIADCAIDVVFAILKSERRQQMQSC